jgi:hypothetical protein
MFLPPKFFPCRNEGISSQHDDIDKEDNVGVKGHQEGLVLRKTEEPEAKRPSHLMGSQVPDSLNRQKPGRNHQHQDEDHLPETDIDAQRDGDEVKMAIDGHPDEQCQHKGPKIDSFSVNHHKGAVEFLEPASNPLPEMQARYSQYPETPIHEKDGSLTADHEVKEKQAEEEHDAGKNDDQPQMFIGDVLPNKKKNHGQKEKGGHKIQNPCDQQRGQSFGRRSGRYPFQIIDIRKFPGSSREDIVVQRMETTDLKNIFQGDPL